MVTLLTFTLGMTSSLVRNRSRASTGPAVRKVGTDETPPVIQSPSPVQDDESMPEELSPWSIAGFINRHPQADLVPLWDKLGVEESNGPFSVRRCGNCEATTSEYDLDDDPGDEAILKVWDREAARFLVFKETGKAGRWKLIGHVDVWGKYIEPYHMILLSSGKPWLVIRGQGASGSGIALYIDYVFQVWGNRLRQVTAYPAAGQQSGAPDGATHVFTARPVSCQVDHGRATVELDLFVTYSFYDRDARSHRKLFAKRQRATLVRRSGSDSGVLDASRSDLSNSEFESVYNVDSLYRELFVKYNFAELSEIAIGKDREQKEWLREYLKTCEPTVEVRKLQRILGE